MTGYCNWCDTLTEDIVEAFNDNHALVWSGCLNCYKKRIELMNNDAGKK